MHTSVWTWRFDDNEDAYSVGDPPMQNVGECCLARMEAVLVHHRLLRMRLGGPHPATLPVHRELVYVMG